MAARPRELTFQLLREFARERYQHYHARLSSQEDKERIFLQAIEKKELALLQLALEKDFPQLRESLEKYLLCG